MAALERGPPDGREGAAWTASSLAADPANIGAFVQADAVPRLLQMLKTGAALYLSVHDEQQSLSESRLISASIFEGLSGECCVSSSTATSQRIRLP